jgi:serine/threonine protein kinase
MEYYVYSGSGDKYLVRPSDRIGEGYSASVYKVSEQVAAKIYKGGELSNKLQEKLSILIYRARELRQNPHLAAIVLPEGFLLDGPNGKIVGVKMRYVAGARPIHHFKWNSQITDESQFDQSVADLLFDICDGITALHKQRIYVSDLKPDNILVANGRAHIVDFDSCSLAPEYLGLNYTEGYLDPRLREDDAHSAGPFEFDAESDWWAVAVVAFHLFTGVLPWEGVDPDTKGTSRDETFALRAFKYRAAYLNQDITFPSSAGRPAVWTQLRPRLFQFFNRIFSDDTSARRPISDILIQEEFRRVKVRNHSQIPDSFRLNGYKALELIERQKQVVQNQRNQHTLVERKALRDQFVNELVRIPKRTKGVQRR